MMAMMMDLGNMVQKKNLIPSSSRRVGGAVDASVSGKGYYCLARCTESKTVVICFIIQWIG